ncbi:hypothetical protein F2Q69_00024604 [Brassica cretica]|uniref:TPX2 central domain-containing protein n=1 Tax=Brassica cretica TaxID=69181 RepID=A0A8S9QCT5_BRACR|nr:hypothetical protein F2Q69_00024604 [Brassica cretica]
MGLLRIFLLGFAAMASSVQGYDAGWVLLLLQPPTSVLPTTLCLITQVVGVALHFTKLVLSLFLTEDVDGVPKTVAVAAGLDGWIVDGVTGRGQPDAPFSQPKDQPGYVFSQSNASHYSDQEDMNFINRRFSIPSICEYPSLEVVSNPTKKRYNPKKGMDFKKDLLAFQKAKNEEKIPRKYGVMAQFSKPVKPVLQLPNLERSLRVFTMHQSPHDQEDLFMATLALFGVSSIQTPTALLSFISGRDQHLPNGKEDSKEAQLSLKTVQDSLDLKGQLVGHIHHLPIRSLSPSIRSTHPSHRPSFRACNICWTRWRDCRWSDWKVCKLIIMGILIRQTKTGPSENFNPQGTETTPEPGANRMHHSANRRTNQDMCSVKTAHLSNQEEFCNETNFHAFYTQLGVNPNWNHLQRYSDQEDMNFINRRFSIPSICEYPSLEVVSSPTKKRYNPKKSMDFKKDLLASKKAKNEEKIQRKYGVIAQFSKPVKPVLQLPNLESHRFNLSQTKQWLPGDVSKHMISISSDS